MGPVTRRVLVVCDASSPLARASHALRAIALACVVLLAAAGAQAQPSPPERELTADERARELYLHGDRSYAEGNYDEAVRAFEQAYALSPRPGLLYNTANALERLGRYESALAYLRRYLSSAAESQRDIVLKRIRSLEVRADEQHQKDQAAAELAAVPAAPEGPSPAAAAPAPVASAPAPRVDAPAPPLPLREPAPPAPVPRATEPPSSPFPIGYVVGGAGVLGIGVGAALGWSAASLRHDAESQCADSAGRTICPDSAVALIADQRRRAIAADIAWGIGAVALGVGLYLVLDASTDDESGQMSLRAAGTPQGGEMNIVMAF